MCPKDETKPPPLTKTMGASPSSSTQQLWPEDDMKGLFWPYKVYLRWTYSYLDPLLQTGSRQKKEGFRLESADLFTVPRTMESEILNEKFR
jgi:hypothetical protein